MNRKRGLAHSSSAAIEAQKQIGVGFGFGHIHCAYAAGIDACVVLRKFKLNLFYFLHCSALVWYGLVPSQRQRTCRGKALIPGKKNAKQSSAAKGVYYPASKAITRICHINFAASDTTKLKLLKQKRALHKRVFFLTIWCHVK